MSKKLKDADTEEQKLKTELAEKEKELERLTHVERKAEAQLKSISDLLTKLRTTMGVELIAIRQKLRLEIRKLVARIEVFPEGLNGKILLWEEEPIQYVDFKDYSADHVKEYDSDIHGSKQEFKNRQIKEKRRIEKFIEDTTGKPYRSFSIWFQAGGFKEIYHDDGVFKISVSGKKYMGLLKSIMSKI